MWPKSFDHDPFCTKLLYKRPNKGTIIVFCRELVAAPSPCNLLWRHCDVLVCACFDVRGSLVTVTECVSCGSRSGYYLNQLLLLILQYGIEHLFLVWLIFSMQTSKCAISFPVFQRHRQNGLPSVYIKHTLPVSLSRKWHCLSHLCVAPGWAGRWSLTEMGDVCMKQKTKWWICVLWRLCNLCMSVFFSLATYVQVPVWFTLQRFRRVVRLLTKRSHLVSDERPRRWIMDGEITETSVAPGCVCGLTAAALCCRSVTGSPQSWRLWSDSTLTWQVGSIKGSFESIICRYNDYSALLVEVKHFIGVFSWFFLGVCSAAVWSNHDSIESNV